MKECGKKTLTNKQAVFIRWNSILNQSQDSKKPSIHRFSQKMATWIYESVCQINDSFAGDPEKIFNQKSDAQIINVLRSFKGIGVHKAKMHIQLK